MLLFIDALAFQLASSGPILLLTLLYVFVCIVAIGSNRTAWLVALTVPAIFCIRGLFLIGVNVVAYARNDLPPYFNGRVVLSIVVFSAIVFVAPSVALITLFWRHRRALGTLVRPPVTSR